MPSLDYEFTFPEPTADALRPARKCLSQGTAREADFVFIRELMHVDNFIL